MVGLSLVLTFPLTIHLLRPINSLTEGTRKLIASHFKTRLPATTGDELHTTLAVLRGEIEALQDGIRQPEPETIDTLLGEIMYLERMVNDLYELSISDIGVLNYKRVEVNPVGILAGI